MQRIRIFRYLDDMDCFVVSDEYQRIADQLGLTEWSPVVWRPEGTRRLFTLDSDDGEHWFDNCHLREPLEKAAAQRGLTEEKLLIIDPERFQDGKDGPCHPPAFRIIQNICTIYDSMARARALFHSRKRPSHVGTFPGKKSQHSSSGCTHINRE